jgi:hypothetical protein
MQSSRLQSARPVAVLLPGANALAGTKTSAPINIAKYTDIEFVLIKGAGAVGTSVVTVEACTDSSGTSPTAIAFNYRKSTNRGDTWGDLIAATAAGFTTSAAANEVYSIEVPGSVSVASVGKNFIRVKTVESVVGAVDATIVAFLHGSKYGTYASLALS